MNSLHPEHSKETFTGYKMWEKVLLFKKLEQKISYNVMDDIEF